MPLDFRQETVLLICRFAQSNQITKTESTDLFVEQKWAIIAKLNLYTNVNTRGVDSNGLDSVATIFKVSQTTVGRIKREHWEQVNSGKLYPAMRPKKKKIVGAKSQ